MAAVKANPGLASQGGAATYGMMAHLPLRGMVKQQVLDLVAKSYRRGAGPLDVSASDGTEAETGHHHTKQRPLLERLAAWYIARKHG